MLPYIALSVMPLVVACIFQNLQTDNKQKKRYLTICGIILILFLGLRNSCLGSTDTMSYYGLFKYARSTSSWKRFYSYRNTIYYGFKKTEIGFQVCVYLLSRITNEPQVLIFFSSVIYIVSLMIFIYNNSKNVIMSVVMYITLGLMVFEMQGMRQSIAMSICLIAFVLFQKKKYILYIGVVLLATLFHKTAIVFFVIILLSRLKMNKRSLILFTSGAIVIELSIDKIISFANDIFNRDYSNTAESGGYIALAIYVLIIVYTLLFDVTIKSEKDMSVIFYMLLLGFLCFVTRYFGVQASERISFYFMFAQLIILPNSIKNSKIRIDGIVYFFCVLLMICRLSGSDLVPYQFF